MNDDVMCSFSWSAVLEEVLLKKVPKSQAKITSLQVKPSIFNPTQVKVLKYNQPSVACTSCIKQLL